VYEEVKLEIGFRADLIVENKVIIDNQISRASYRRTSKTTTDLLKIDQPKAWPLNKFQ
jgi:competence CoiA-like predicted nuclease